MNTPCTPVGWAKFGILLLPVAVLLLNATAVVSMQTPATVTEERVLVALIDYCCAMIKRSGVRCCDSSMIARCNPCPRPKIVT